MRRPRKNLYWGLCSGLTPLRVYAPAVSCYSILSLCCYIHGVCLLERLTEGRVLCVSRKPTMPIKPGDRILVLKEHWLKLITKKKKTMEIRGRAVKGGKYWLGYKGVIRGKAVLQHPVCIKDETTWASLRDQHRVESEHLPYRNTWGLTILSARAVPPVKYVHPRGAVGIVIYKNPAEEDKRD